ncbi:MAG: peptide deformylase [Flavobacteriales bacterium]|nr:peptide deformylase [Flavobacteriales bacterium]
MSKILPIVAYGDPVLKKVGEEIDEKYPKLDELVANMFETMYNASGIGLAAPQIGKSIRLFIIDATPFAEEHPELDGFTKVFINPIILEEDGKRWAFNEGCLSIPGIREDVNRKPEILIEYYDENWELQEDKFDGLVARVIQHEYDHIEGILFTDKITALRRRLVKGKLKDISNGIVDVEYKMKFHR